MLSKDIVEDIQFLRNGKEERRSEAGKGRYDICLRHEGGVREDLGGANGEELFNPTSGTDPSADTGNWSPRGCSGSWSCNNSPSAGGRSCRRVLCKLA